MRCVVQAEYPILHGSPGDATLIGGEIPDEESVHGYSQILICELCKYLDGFFRRVKMDQILLSRGLRVGDRRATGLPLVNVWTGNDSTEGVTLEDAWKMVIVDVTTAARPRLAAHVLHHEIYHVIDVSVYGYNNGDSDGEHTGWNDTTMCPPALESRPGDRPLGFASRYATSSAAEDKAETFARMMTDGSRIGEDCSNDPVLARKCSLIAHQVRKLDAGFEFVSWH